MRRLRICLVSPPLTDPSVPNLAIELLAAAAREAGHTAHTLHAPLLQPRVFQGDLIHALPAPMAFAPFYVDGDPEVLADAAARAVYREFAQVEHLTPGWIEAFSDQVYFSMNDAEICLERICARIEAGFYDLIGFSVGFDAQKLPTACLARRLRERGETGFLVAGGTGCDGVMGPALLEFCPELDVVLQGETDRAWVELLDAVSARLPLARVPGAVTRSPAGAIVVTAEQPFDGAFLRNPRPSFDAYFEQRLVSRYADSRSFVLFEASRGCWWGERRQCTFCGIRNVSGPYRSRSPDETVQLIEDLQRRYHPDCLYATDSIADRSNDHTLWPALARRRLDGQDWRLFFESKSDLTRPRVALLAAAGVRYLQPGIESFSSHVLRLVRKGATGLQQVAMLKWAQTYGIDLHYSLMTRLPGETGSDVAAMLKWISAIHHLPPPGGVNRLALHRFSPYFDEPEQFGITRVRPFAIQRVMYQASDELLMRLCYQLNFDFDGSDDAELAALRESLRSAVEEWQRDYDSGTRLTMSIAGPLVVVRRQGSSGSTMEIVHDPLEVRILQHAQEVTRLEALVLACGAGRGDVEAALERLEQAGLLLTDRHAAVVLAVPEQAECFSESGVTGNPVAGVREPQFVGLPQRRSIEEGES